MLTASWLLSATNVLDEYVKVISRDESSRSMINKKSQHMKRYIVPMITYATKYVMEISKSPCTHSLSESCPPSNGSQKEE